MLREFQQWQLFGRSTLPEIHKHAETGLLDRDTTVESVDYSCAKQGYKRYEVSCCPSWVERWTWKRKVVSSQCHEFSSLNFCWSYELVQRKGKLTIQFKTFLMCQISLSVYQFIFSILLVRYSLCSELYKFKLLSHTLNSITEGSSAGKMFLILDPICYLVCFPVGNAANKKQDECFVYFKVIYHQEYWICGNNFTGYNLEWFPHHFHWAMRPSQSRCTHV